MVCTVAAHQRVSLCWWYWYIGEETPKHLEDRMGTWINLSNSIFIDWSLKAAVLASVLFYVLVGSHVAPNDTIGWGTISDKVKEDLETYSALRVTLVFCRTSCRKTGISTAVKFSGSAFFFVFPGKWSLWATMNAKSIKSEVFRSFLLKNTNNVRKKVKKLTF